MRTIDEIVGLYRQRRDAMLPAISRMIEIRELYEGDYVVPLPELDANEKPAVANLAQQGIDQTGMRIASTLPDPRFEPERRGIKKWEDAARERRRAIRGWWDENDLPIIMGRRARWYVAYGSGPVEMGWDPVRGIPMWNPMDPLTCYPAPSPNPDSMTPPDNIRTFHRTWKWIVDNYPDQSRVLRRKDQVRGDDKFQCLKYVDHEQLTLVVLGDAKDGTHNYATGSAEYVTLEQAPNRAGICPAVVPGRVTLDRILGQFDGIVGQFQMQAKLMALEVIAAERGVFPEVWVYSGDQRDAKIVTVADGRTGQIGKIQGGQIQVVAPQPGFAALQSIDRIERSQRIEGGIPSEMTGEAASTVRTARRGGQIMSATIDFRIQEAQTVFAKALRHEDVRGIAIQKAYRGSKSVSFYMSSKDSKESQYDPTVLWSSDAHYVRYSLPGADANELANAGGQRVGIGTMSRRSFMELDPLVDDAEEEHDRIVAERLENASLTGLETAASSDPSFLPIAARVSELVLSNREEVYKAVQTAQRELQEQQATPMPAEDPSMQPGMAAPEDPGAMVPEGPPDLNRLAGMMRDLRATA